MSGVNSGLFDFVTWCRSWDNRLCAAQAQQGELGRLQQRCKDAEAKIAALMSEQQAAGVHISSQLEVPCAACQRLEALGPISV